jgi:hypothetical protein
MSYGLEIEFLMGLIDLTVDVGRTLDVGIDNTPVFIVPKTGTCT